MPRLPNKLQVHVGIAPALLFLFLGCHLAKSAQAQPTVPAALCHAAAQRAASITGVPEKVLAAIALAETGRTIGRVLQPWPWAMNTGGRSHWFDTQDELLAAAGQVLRADETNVDLGCFQLNYRWHGSEFSSLDQMIDPGSNALYAARFLARLHDETGDWAAAAAAYHSRTPAYAAEYKTKFVAILARLHDPNHLQSEGTVMELADATDIVAQRTNRFPLLRPGAHGAAGSLVPLGDGGPPLIGGS